MSSDSDVFIKRYRLRAQWGKGSITVTVPRGAFEREARKFKMTPEEAVKKLIAIWRYDTSGEMTLRFIPELT